MIVRATSRYHVLPRPLRAFLHALAALGVVAIGFANQRAPGVLPPWLLYAAIVFFCVLFAVLHLSPTTIVLGHEAVEIRWLGLTRRIALASVASVSAELDRETHTLSGRSVTLHHAVIHLVLCDGGAVRVRIGGAGDAEPLAQRDELVEAIRRGAARE